MLEAVVDGDREFPQQPTGEVSTAPPMPEESAGSESVQPDEENEISRSSAMSCTWEPERKYSEFIDRPARDWHCHGW